MIKINQKNYKVFQLDGIGGGGFDRCEAQLKNCEGINNDILRDLVTLYKGKKDKDHFKICKICRNTLRNELIDLTTIKTLNEISDLLDQQFPNNTE